MTMASDLLNHLLSRHYYSLRLILGNKKIRKVTQGIAQLTDIVNMIFAVKILCAYRVRIYGSMR